MSCINDVRLQGKLLKAPEFAETSGKKRFARLAVETEKFVRINGESRRIAAVHQVVVFNQFSLPALQEGGREGTYVTVFGELGYDRNGKAEIVVSQYSGEARIVTFAAPASAQEPAAPAAETKERPAPQPRSSGGGLGRLPKGRDSESIDPRDGEGAKTPAATSRRDEDLDDDIPF